MSIGYSFCTGILRPEFLILILPYTLLFKKLSLSHPWSVHFLVRKCLLTPNGSFPYLILYLCSCNCCLLKWNNSLCLAQHPRNFLPWISLLGFRKRLLPNVYQSRLRTHFAWVSKYRNRSDLNCTSERSSVSQRDPGFFFKSKQPFLRAVKHE